MKNHLLVPRAASVSVGLLLFGGLVLIATTGRSEPSASQTNLEPSRTTTTRDRLDLYGDPLPPDAIARMGSIRWRNAGDLHIVPSPNGRIVATYAEWEGRIRVCELSTGRKVCEFAVECNPAGYVMRFSLGDEMRFTPEGSRLMLLTNRGIVKFYQPLTGKLLGESKPVLEKEAVKLMDDGRKWCDTSHRFTVDGRWIVTTHPEGDNCTLLSSEVNSEPSAVLRQVKLDFPPGSFNIVGHNPFVSDGRNLVGRSFVDENGLKPLILRWDLHSGKLCREILLDAVNEEVVAFSSDGKRAVTLRESPRVWDAETGTESVKLEKSAGIKFGTQFSPDNKKLVGATNDSEVASAMVWELDHGMLIGQMKHRNHHYHSYFLLPDDKTMLMASLWGAFGTWDIATGQRISPDTGHESRVRQVVFTHDGKTLLTDSTDFKGPIIAWDAASGKRLHQLKIPSGPYVLSPGGSLVTADRWRGTLIWVDARTGRELQRNEPEKAIEVDPDQRASHDLVSLSRDPLSDKPAVFQRLLVGGISIGTPVDKQGVVVFRDAVSGELLFHRPFQLRKFDCYGPVSPDGRLQVRHTYDFLVQDVSELNPARTNHHELFVLESTTTGRVLLELRQPDEPSFNVLFTPDGQTLITWTTKYPPRLPDGIPAGTMTVRLWELRSGKQRLEFTLPVIGKWRQNEPQAVAISPSGRFLVAPRPDKAIHVWDLATGAEVAKRSGHDSEVWSLAFAPDGKTLASGHSDGTAMVWDLSGLPGVIPAATDRDAAWKDLASNDAAKAYRAIVALAADPECVAFLRDRVKPVPEVARGEIQKLVKDLNDDDFTTREAATAMLKKLGDLAEAELQTQLQGRLSPEQRRRIDEVLSQGGLKETDPERLRALRCIEVLEKAGSSKARSLLDRLAKGALKARLTREASGAVQRMAPRSR